MKVEFVDFKTVNLSSMLDTGMSSELSLTQTGKVSAKIPDEWNGFAILYLSIKISDPEEKHFMFDITTETIVKLPDDIREFSDEAMNAGLEIARAKTFEAIRTISVGMGINELDLGAKG